MNERSREDLGEAGVRGDVDDSPILDHDVGMLLYDDNGRGGEPAARIALPTSKSGLGFRDDVDVR